jgi:lysophospholipase L1-like esterase
MINRFAAFAAVLALSCPALATVLGTQPPARYVCNGTTVSYAIPFAYLATSDLLVTTGTKTLALTTDYTVTPSKAPTTGTLKLVAGSRCPSGTTLTITRNMALTQPQGLRTGSYKGDVVEQTLDRATMQIQQNAATHATDKAAQTAKDTAQDAALASATVGGPVLVTAVGLRTAVESGIGVGNGATTGFQIQQTPVTLKVDSLGTWANGTKPRTNLFWWSQAFDNAAWAKQTGVTVTADNTAAPDGTVTADRIVYDGTGTSGSFRVVWNGGFASTIGKTYTESVWLRADVTIGISIGDTASGSVALPITLNQTWQRFSITSTATSVTAYKLFISSASGSNAPLTIYAWGAQAEDGRVATQYIPTTNAFVTVSPTYWPGTADGFVPVYDLRPAAQTELPLTYQPLNMAIEGDSITQQPSSIGGVTSWPALLGYPTASGATFTDWAVAGTRTADMLTRFTMYQGNGYNQFIVLGGINDITQDVPLATIQANLTAMWTGARALWMNVTAMTVPPFKNDTAADWTTARQGVLDTLNAWIRTQAATNGYGLVDTYAILGDPANLQQQLATLTSDGKHPNTAGQQLIANAVKAVLTNNVTPRYLSTPTLSLDGDWQGKRLLYPTARTNLTTQSAPTTAWVTQVSGTGVAATITYAFAAAPDGTTTATRVQLNQGAGTTSADFCNFKGPSLTGTIAPAPYTFSMWVKTNDGTTKKVTMDLGGATTILESFSGTWQHYSYTTTAGGTLSPRLQVRGTFGTDTTADLLVWGAQLETGTLPTSLITTTGSAVTVTDYSATPTGGITLATPPASGAFLMWTGGYYDRATSP